MIMFFALSIGLATRACALSPSEFSDSWAYPINGHEPDGAGPFPLFIYIGGTGADQNGPNTEQFTRKAAYNGVVGAAVHYFNGYNCTEETCDLRYPFSCDAWSAKAEEMFSTANASSAVSVLCARENVNCSLGIVVAGFSQGAQLASLSANFVEAFEVTAVYEMAGGDYLASFFNFSECLSFEALSWNQSQIRGVTGARDEFFGSDADGVRDILISITGRSCSNTTFDCLQEDGSGWYIAQDSEVGNATHCYAFEDGMCFAGVFRTEYYAPAAAGLCDTSCEWSFGSNMDWLLGTLNLTDAPTTSPSPPPTMEPTDTDEPSSSPTASTSDPGDNGSGSKRAPFVVGAMVSVVAVFF